MRSVLKIFICAQLVSAATIGKGFQSFPLVKRDQDVYGAGLSGSPFSIEVTLGSNQSTHVFLEVDTGSFDLLVPPYDYNASTAYTNLNETFDHTIGARRIGVWIEDDVSIGEGPVVNAGLVVQNPGSPLGLWGAHFKGDQPNYIQVLKSEGYINKATFSIWYNHSVGAGEILFGAYDAAKFDGPLVKTNLTTPGEGSWHIPTGGIVTQDGVTHFANQSATLDSGNANFFLPLDQLKELQASLPGSTWEGNYISYPTCDFTDDQKLGFAFGEALVEINLRDISYGYDGKCALYFHEGSPVYGAPFISNAFTIFDLDEKTISLANRKYSDEVDIVILE